ncbi:MAG TPA: delta-60 repeat domain-containing protein [Verrucomicrobiae bacterium]
MKNNLRSWIRAAALVAGGFPVITAITLQAQTADSFDPRMSFIIPGGAHTPAEVKGLAVQPDGRSLLGGTFNDINGVPRFDLARFQPSGALETAFQPLTTGAANRVGVFPDGRILAYEVTTPFYFRHLPGGGSDPGFSVWAMPNFAPSASLIYPDGRFVSAFVGPDSPLRRWNADGSEDFSLQAYCGPMFVAEAKVLALQRDGKILVGGNFESVNDVPRAGLARLNPDGSVDTAFDPGAMAGGFPGYVECLAVQGDGKIVVVGGFDTVGGTPNNGIVRLNPDGTADTNFTASLDHCCPGIYANSLALQADGKILIGGSFDTLNGQLALNLARLNSDGSLDSTFNPASDGEVTALALDASGRLLVSGYFTHLGGQARAGMARLLNTGSATEALAYQGTTVTWLRGGTAPDVWATTFELSTNNSTWTLLGEGAPIAGGWQLTGVSVPLGGRIRARGYVASGFGNASLGIVESTLTVSLRVLSANPTPQPFGFSVLGPATQSVVIEGSINLRDWIPLRTNLVPASGLLPFTDLDSPTLPQRFYRGRGE